MKIFILKKLKEDGIEWEDRPKDGTHITEWVSIGPEAREQFDRMAIEWTDAEIQEYINKL